MIRAKVVEQLLSMYLFNASSEMGNDSSEKKAESIDSFSCPTFLLRLRGRNEKANPPLPQMKITVKFFRFLGEWGEVLGDEPRGALLLSYVPGPFYFLF